MSISKLIDAIEAAVIGRDLPAFRRLLPDLRKQCKTLVAENDGFQKTLVSLKAVLNVADGDGGKKKNQKPAKDGDSRRVKHSIIDRPECIDTSGE